jgi:hypothetical protein
MTIEHRLPINDELMTKAVLSYFSAIIRANSMYINSYFEAWGLGKNDLTDYPFSYQHLN